ncbi:MAG: ARMT1-like domain-containing protein, partial [Clostridia bacterium]|nr:ARMT1-like domain-containing protein [Clostridia bacterium]
ILMKNKRLNSACIECLTKKHLTAYPENAKETDKLSYMKKMLGVISEANDDMSAPELVEEINKIKEEFFGRGDDYSEIKKHFNALMLKEEPSLTAEIEKAENSFKKALSFAMAANYIDFGAMYKVDEETLKESFYNKKEEHFPEEEKLYSDLKKAKNLLYITDNCGEIVADKIFIKEIMKEFPHLSVKAMVRGKEVLNDATIEDATDVGLDLIVPVIPNGTGVPGTSIKKLSPEAKKAFDEADVIISKGQGNFETLMYSGKNIYYIFMCKCSMFAKRFNVEPLSGMLLNDLRM